MDANEKPKTISHTADDSDDDDDDGWNEVERAGAANKANANVYSYKQLEEETQRDQDAEPVKLKAAAQLNKENKLLQQSTQQTGQRGSGPSNRYTTSRAKSKWGTVEVDPLGDNQWDSYARGMDHSRQDNIKKMKKKDDSSEDDDW